MRLVIIESLRPEDDRYALQLQPIDQRPDHEIPQMQKHNDACGVNLLNFFSITGKVGADLLEVKHQGVRIFFLQFSAPDYKFKAMVAKSFRKVIVDRDSVVHNPIGYEQDCFHYLNPCINEPSKKNGSDRKSCP